MDVSSRVRRLSALAAVAVLSACSTRGAGGVGDPATVGAEVARRTGVEAPTPPEGPDDGSVDPAALALLSAPLTEDAAVKLALVNDPSVRAAYERLGIATADLIQAGLLSNPVFSANAKSFTRGGPEVELGLAQSFVDLFLRPLKRRVAAEDLRAAGASVERDLVCLAFDVRRAFVVARAADGLVVTRARVLESATTSSDLVRRLHEAGNVVDREVTLAEMVAARARLDLDAAKAAARDAREPLNVLLGLRGDAVRWTVAEGTPPDPAPTDARDVEARAVAASLDLAESAALVDSATAAAGLSSREAAWPRLDLGAVAKRESGGAWGYGPEVVTSLPVFDVGQARCLAGRATIRERFARHARLTVEVESAARRFADRAKSLSDRAKTLADSVLPLESRYVEETRKNYEAMQVGAFEVLAARRHQADAEREHAEAVRDARLARLDLDEILAGCLDASRLDAAGLPREPERLPDPKGR